MNCYKAIEQIATASLVSGLSVLRLLKGGANPDLGKKFPLSSAARHGHSAVVKILLEHHVYIGATDSDGNPCVSWAFEECQEAIAGHNVGPEVGSHYPFHRVGMNDQSRSY